MRKKILCLSLGTALAVILILLSVSMSVTISIGKRQVVENGNAKTRLIAQGLDGVIDHALYNVKAFSTSNALQSALRETYCDDAYGVLKFSSSLRSSITNIMDIDTLVSNGFVQQTPSNWRYHFSNNSVSFEPDDSALAAVRDSHGRILLSVSEGADGDGNLHVDKQLIEIETGKTLGMLSFDLSTDSLSGFFASSVGGDESVFLFSDTTLLAESDNLSLLEDGRGDVVSCIASRFANKKIGGNRYAFFSRELTSSDAVLLYAVSYQSLFRQAWEGSLLISLISLGLVVAVIIVTLAFSRSLTTPLERLMWHAERISRGMFDPITDIPPGHDEIGKLASCMNEMIGNIQRMSARIYRQQNEKRESELALLEAQINPHFLSNCMDNVSSLLEEGNVSLSRQMIDGIGSYYRLVLSGGRNIITLGEEASLVRAYLRLQNLRHPHLFTWTLDLPQDLALYKCLKMVFQPLVENSLTHGFAGKTEGGRISILVTEERETIVCRISDNGCGMTEASVEALQEMDGEGKHYGIRSVRERLLLAYGREGVLSVQSRKGEGTTMTIRFPKNL